MPVEIVPLSTGLPLLLAPLPATPRMALAVTIDGGVREEPIAGVAKLSSRLLLKGTARRTAEQLALELDEHAIDLHEISRADCTLLLAIFLPKELPVVLDILQDVLRNSTFSDFPREREKLLGEVQASMDLPASIANNLLVSTLLQGHPYGNTGLRFLETADQLREEQVCAWHYTLLNPARMNVTAVGDFEPESLLPQLQEAFGAIVGGEVAGETPLPVPIDGDRVVTAARADAQQAQVYQGWYAPGLGCDEQAALSVMNTILGGGGLSNRLFINLRDKQGLAYSVHSQYLPMRQVGEFIISIGTSPENIARARAGFTEQLARMQQEPITLDELEHAKGRLRGSYVLSHETAPQHCQDIAINHINGLGPTYADVLLNRIETVSIEDVQHAAQRIHAPSVTAIVAREDALVGLA